MLKVMRHWRRRSGISDVSTRTSIEDLKEASQREAESVLDKPPFKRQRIYDVANNLNSEQVRVFKRTLNSGTLTLGKRQKPSRSISQRWRTHSKNTGAPLIQILSTYMIKRLSRVDIIEKRQKKNVFEMLYFLNFVIKLNMALVVYALATYFVDACIIIFACINRMYECRNFCVKIWVVTLAVGTYDNTIKRILLLLLLLLLFIIYYKFPFSYHYYYKLPFSYHYYYKLPFSYHYFVLFTYNRYVQSKDETLL